MIVPALQFAQITGLAEEEEEEVVLHILHGRAIPPELTSKFLPQVLHLMPILLGIPEKEGVDVEGEGGDVVHPKQTLVSLPNGKMRDLWHF